MQHHFGVRLSLPKAPFFIADRARQLSHLSPASPGLHPRLSTLKEKREKDANARDLIASIVGGGGTGAKSPEIPPPSHDTPPQSGYTPTQAYATPPPPPPPPSYASTSATQNYASTSADTSGWGSSPTVNHTSSTKTEQQGQGGNYRRKSLGCRVRPLSPASHNLSSNVIVIH